MNQEYFLLERNHIRVELISIEWARKALRPGRGRDLNMYILQFAGKEASLRWDWAWIIINRRQSRTTRNVMHLIMTGAIEVCLGKEIFSPVRRRNSRYQGTATLPERYAELQRESPGIVIFDFPCGQRKNSMISGDISEHGSRQRTSTDLARHWINCNYSQRDDLTGKKSERNVPLWIFISARGYFYRGKDSKFKWNVIL